MCQQIVNLTNPSWMSYLVPSYASTMIRNLATRGRLAAAVHGTAGPASSPLSTSIVSSSARPFSHHNSSNIESTDRSSHRRSRSPSTSPHHRQPRRTMITQVMSPKPSSSLHRSYGTAPLTTTQTFVAGATTYDHPVRHTLYHSLHEASTLPLSSSLHHHQEDYDQWYRLQDATVETVISATSSTAAANTATTDVDMDLVSDDDEWLPPFDILSLSSAEQVLSMMDNSYYHASYQATTDNNNNNESDAQDEDEWESS